ncbi:MAG: Rieske 2Fe-2S domain-containing protein [Actinomycetota bacterium]|nr:Rieske 2Fe-2S domain-containing protein [Actinomycetota bacterium]MEC7968275.1 Rieske 2Fe-2S domain-containing protein [Actinomycetota bacterium]
MLIAAIVVIAVLAAVAVFSALKSRDADGAVGILSRETKSRDRESTVLGDEDALTGKQVERAQVLERKAASKELVLAARESAPPAPYVPPDPEVIGVSRRQFFNRTIILMMQIGLGGFGLASIAFLWPQLGGGFGSAIRVGLVSDVLSEIRGANGFLYRAEGRMWITEYPNGAVEKARAAYSANELTGMESGLALGLDGGVIALYQKCPHLGCRVPECVTSQWFECPCHGSQYNRVGEKRGGPAPRGMDRFAMSVSADGVLTVDTGTIIQGPPIGTNTTGQEAEGPNCIGQSSH